MEMTTSEAIEVLKAHNEWRRDDNIPNSKAMVNPTELGKALDKAVEVMGREVDRFKGCEELSNDRPHIANDDWIRFMNKQLGITSVRDLE